MYDILQLNDMLVPELKDLAEELGLKSYKRLNKQQLIYKILDHQALKGGKKPDGGDDKGKDNAKSQSKTPTKKPKVEVKKTKV